MRVWLPLRDLGRPLREEGEPAREVEANDGHPDSHHLHPRRPEPFIQRFFRGSGFEERALDRVIARGDALVVALTAAVFQAPASAFKALAYLTVTVLAELAQSGISDAQLRQFTERVRQAWSSRLTTYSAVAANPVVRLILRMIPLETLISRKMNALPRDNPQNFKDLTLFLRLEGDARTVVRGLAEYLEPHPLDDRLRRLVEAAADIQNPVVMSLAEFSLVASANADSTAVLEFLPQLFEHAWLSRERRAGALQSCLFTYFTVLDQLDPAAQAPDWLETMFVRYTRLLNELMTRPGSPRGKHTTSRGIVWNPNLHCYGRLRAKLLPYLKSAHPDLLRQLIDRALSMGRGDEELFEVVLRELRVLATEIHAWPLAVDHLVYIANRLETSGENRLGATANALLVSALDQIRVYLPGEVDHFLRRHRVEAEGSGAKPTRLRQRGEESLSTASHVMMFRYLSQPGFVTAVRRVIDRATDGRPTVQGSILGVLDDIVAWLSPPAHRLRDK